MPALLAYGDCCATLTVDAFLTNLLLQTRNEGQSLTRKGGFLPRIREYLVFYFGPAGPGYDALALAPALSSFVESFAFWPLAFWNRGNQALQDHASLPSLLTLFSPRVCT